MIQIFGRKRCNDTRKAQRFFSERRIPFQFVDLDIKAPSPRELEVFVRAIGADELLDRGSRAFCDRGLKYLEFDAFEELSENPELMRTPVVREGNRATAGADKQFWSSLAQGHQP